MNYFLRDEQDLENLLRLMIQSMKDNNLLPKGCDTEKLLENAKKAIMDVFGEASNVPQALFQGDQMKKTWGLVIDLAHPLPEIKGTTPEMLRSIQAHLALGEMVQDKNDNKAKNLPEMKKNLLLVLEQINKQLPPGQRMDAKELNKLANKLLFTIAPVPNVASLPKDLQEGLDEPLNQKEMVLVQMWGASRTGIHIAIPQYPGNLMGISNFPPLPAAIPGIPGFEYRVDETLNQQAKDEAQESTRRSNLLHKSPSPTPLGTAGGGH